MKQARKSNKQKDIKAMAKKKVNVTIQIQGMPIEESTIEAINLALYSNVEAQVLTFEQLLSKIHMDKCKFQIVTVQEQNTMSQGQQQYTGQMHIGGVAPVEAPSS